MAQPLLIALLIAIVPMVIFLSVKRMRTERRLVREFWQALTRWAR